MTQEKQIIFLDKVRKMRGYQKEYFKYRVRSDLETAKRYEREVDKLIEEEIKAIKSQQLTLINE